MTAEEFLNIRHTIPEEAGVYQFIGPAGKPIYVGKAVNLRKRLQSYFSHTDHPLKVQLMLRQAKSIDFTVVSTENDALLLENQLIKRFQPRYNIQLRDDKTYPWIAILKEPFPRVLVTRRPDPRHMILFGPYTSAHAVRDLLEMIRTLYPLRTCAYALTEKNIAAGKFRLCLEYHIGRCKGPCVGLQSAEHYDEQIRQIRRILLGHFSEVIEVLQKQMLDLAAQHRFEEAEAIKKKLQFLQNYQSRSVVVHPSISHVDVFAFLQTPKHAYLNCLRILNGVIVQSKLFKAVRKMEEPQEEVLALLIQQAREALQSTSPEIIVPFPISFSEHITVTVPQRGDKKKLLELAQKNLYYQLHAIENKQPDRWSDRNHPALVRLQQDFRLKDLPTHIECFDVSNFQGAQSVAALVVFKNGLPAPKEYRHFRIRTVPGPNDFASVEEIVYRRYRRQLDEQQPLPQLIVIDGGKGQLSAACHALEKLSLAGQIPVIGIAKRLEEIYFVHDPIPLHLDKKSPALRLLQHLRNEAHRFAITHHRSLRQKQTIRSELTTIKGIGKQTALKLLRHFRSVAALRAANFDDLAAIVGKHKATLVAAHFHQAQQK